MAWSESGGILAGEVGRVSCYFECESGTLWNPSNATAALFLGYASAMEDVIKVKSGFGGMVDDECQVDAGQLADFCRGISSLISSGNNLVIASLGWDLLVVADVLLMRSGRVFVSEFSSEALVVKLRSEAMAMSSRMPQ